MSSIFDGRRIELRGAFNSGSEIVELLLREGKIERADLSYLVVVSAEDLGMVELLIMDLRDPDKLVWVNPASPSEAVYRQVTAVRLLAEAEQITADSV